MFVGSETGDSQIVSYDAESKYERRISNVGPIHDGYLMEDKSIFLLILFSYDHHLYLIFSVGVE